MLGDFWSGLMNLGTYDERKVENDTVGDYEIDTCYTYDCGYETAILKNEGSWVIVERYSSKENSIKGHKRWVEWCTNNPNATGVISVDSGEMEEF